MENQSIYSVNVIQSGLVQISTNGFDVYYDNERMSLHSLLPDCSSVKHSVSLLEIVDGDPFPDAGSRKHLSRLTLNVTKACNLRCTYCYAEFGKYGDSAKEQEIFELMDALEAVVLHYHSIDKVQFFGGEPLLAMRKIKIAVEFFEKATLLGFLTQCPKFSVVTNGTLLCEDNVLDFFKSKKVHVTVSLDGSREITNALRPQAGKKIVDTYELASTGIRAVQEAGLSVAIEGTYTALHQRLGMTPIDIVDHISGEFGLKSVHIAPAAYSPWGDLRPDSKLSSMEFFNAALHSGRRIVGGTGAVLDMSIGVASQLSKRERVKGYCPAYTTQLSLDASGNVYPCFMSMSVQETKLGHIANDTWPTENAKLAYEKYKSEMRSGQFGVRHNTWFDSLVTGCAAADFLADRRYGYDSDYSVHEAIVAGTLLGLTQGLSASSI